VPPFFSYCLSPDNFYLEAKSSQLPRYQRAVIPLNLDNPRPYGPASSTFLLKLFRKRFKIIVLLWNPANYGNAFPFPAFRFTADPYCSIPRNCKRVPREMTRALRDGTGADGADSPLTG
jgi:hypothetical protein